MIPFLSFKCILFAGIGFISGSVMYSYIIPKMLKNIDVRETAPDHNPGGMNAIHAAGLPIGLICIFCDIGKAFAPVYLAVTAGNIQGWELIPVVLSPVLGHAFSPLLGFKGGKAVSCEFGALLGLWPSSRIVLLLALTTIFFKFIAVVRPDSACMAVSICFACILTFFFEPEPSIRAAFLLAQAVVLYRVMRKPNAGEPSICLGHYTLRIENRKLTFRRL